MGEIKRIRTEELLRMLVQERNLEQFFLCFEETWRTVSFAEYLRLWCKRQGLVPEQVIRRANLEKSFGHQLFSGKRNPSRDTVLQLAFALEADVAQTQELLRVARKSTLYPRIKRDTVIIYCLHNHVSLVDTEIILEELGLPILGGKES